MSSFVRRAAFALAFLDYNVLGSGAIDSRLADAVGAQRRATAWRSWRRSCPTTATRTRSSLDGRVVVGRRRLHHDEPLPVRPAHRQRRPADRATAASTATPTTSATASRPSSTPTTARCTFYVRTTTTRSSRRGRARSATCSRPATRCRRSCASTCATPRTCSGCRPTCTPSTSSTRRDFFEREGAWSVAQAPSVDPRESTTRGDAADDDARRPAGAGRPRVGVVDEPVHARTTRCSRDPTGERRGLRDPAPVRAVLDAPTSAPSCRRT